MVTSSFSPVPGNETSDELQRLRRSLPVRQRTAGGTTAAGFSHYVSSRTVLAGGCPAVDGEAVARAARPRAARRRRPSPL